MKVSKITAVGGLGKGDPLENARNTPRTKPIKHVQTGVTDGRTGKPSTYVYNKLPTDKGFDVKKDRETVYNENLPILQRTVEYQEYRKGLSTKK